MQAVARSVPLGAAGATVAQRPRASPFLGCGVRGSGVARAPRPVWTQAQRQRAGRRAAVGPVQVAAALPVPWLVTGAAAVGVFLGLLAAKLASNFWSSVADSKGVAVENAQLRAKVEELQQLVVSLEPLAYKRMHLRFTRGINKAVILGLVDELLTNKEVNIWWLPDSIERLFYYNVITLMLSVMDEVVEGVSVNMMGHNVKLQLTYLDVEREGTQGRAGRSGSPPPAVLQPAA